MIKNIGFVSTRFAGTDGVSLESSKWAKVFEDNGFSCFWFAGEEDRMILQPTRIIQRKGIEWAIDLVKDLRNDRNKLVISHEAGDEGANMPFESVLGLKGKVYVPAESREGSKKYPCKDCFACQQCSDDRCRVCLSERKCKEGKGYRSWSI